MRASNLGNRINAGNARKWLLTCLAFVQFSVVSSDSFASGAKLPPVGQRRYLLDHENPSAPVAIQSTKKAEPSRARYLKDPVQPSKDAKVIRPQLKVRPKPVVVKRTPVKPAHLRFKSMSVNGHLKRPRVDFGRDLLPLGRADEPLADDFYQKVFEPAQDSSF